MRPEIKELLDKVRAVGPELVEEMSDDDIETMVLEYFVELCEDIQFFEVFMDQRNEDLWEYEEDEDAPDS